MNPPYEITTTILKRIAAISEKLGEINAHYLVKPSPKLRKQNRIQTIHASLQIEGNTLSEDQITALIDHKRVFGPEKDITEVVNAIKVYEQLDQFHFNSEKKFLLAHKELMKNLIMNPGIYRTKGIGIVKGNQVQHFAPPAENVPFLMKELFAYLKTSKELTLIKSCVFHYEMEFIHPFLDGNGRMGRLWQTIILLSEYPVFEYLPFETLISKNQKAYYEALAQSDKQGKSTIFIEYMLEIINNSLENLLNYRNLILNEIDRLDYFLRLDKTQFTRKDYMNTFKNLSSATASRDLKKGLELNLFKSTGKHNQTIYLKFEHIKDLPKP